MGDVWQVGLSFSRSLKAVDVAHRKPLGTTCKIGFAARDVDWDPMPALDDFLVTDAGTAYRIVGVEEGKSRTTYVCERVADTSECEGMIFEFYWMRRK